MRMEQRVLATTLAELLTHSGAVTVALVVGLAAIAFGVLERRRPGRRDVASAWLAIGAGVLVATILVAGATARAAVILVGRGYGS